MPTTFISYRRADSASAAGRLYDRLVERYGRAAVFKDVDSIPPGASFPAYIAESIQASDVALVIIGRRWFDASAGFGRRRLDDPADFVRIEIETALKLGAPVIPVLVEGATLPPARRLPASLRPLLEQNAVALRPDPDFSRDMERIFAAVDHWAAQPRREPPADEAPIEPLPATPGEAGEAEAALEQRRSRIATAAPAPSREKSARKKSARRPSSQRVAGWAAVALTLAVAVALVIILKPPLGTGAVSLTPAESRATALADTRATATVLWHAVQTQGAIINNAKPIPLGYHSANPGCDTRYWIPPLYSHPDCSVSAMTLHGGSESDGVSAAVSGSGVAYTVQVTVSNLRGWCAIDLNPSSTQSSSTHYVIILGQQSGQLAWGIWDASNRLGPAPTVVKSGNIALASSYVVAIRTSVDQTGFQTGPANWYGQQALQLTINGVRVEDFEVIEPPGGSYTIAPGALSHVGLALYGKAAFIQSSSDDSITFSNFSVEHSA